MAFDIWCYYALAILVLTASPGPSSLLCLSTGVTTGWRSMCFTALGSVTAITLILTLSFTGLGMVIATSDIAFSVIKWTGAGYLIYLGIKALLAKQDDFNRVDSINTSPRAARQFWSGFVVGASNPKAIVFFTALFPQFIDPQLPLLTQYTVFASTFICFELSWLLFYGFLGTRSSAWVFKHGRAKLFNRLTGGVFVGAGALLSTASRG